jgi:hypothetical protein
VELCQWKTAVCHERFVLGQEQLGLLEQLPLQRGFAWRIGVGTHQQAGDGEPLGAHPADAGGNAQRDCRKRLARCGTVVLGRTPVQARTPEAH